MRVRVLVKPKKHVLDPQGESVKHTLLTMGFDDVNEVRVGKVIDLEFGGAGEAAAIKEKAQLMAHKLLANPMIEDFEIEIMDDK